MQGPCTPHPPFLCIRHTPSRLTFVLQPVPESSTLPVTPRNKNLSKVFLPLYDDNEGPTPQPTQLTCGPSHFHESTEVIPAALRERGERQEHETQLQNLDRYAAARGRTFCRRARSVQPGLNRNSDRRTAPTASNRRSPAMPRSGR